MCFCRAAKTVRTLGNVDRYFVHAFKEREREREREREDFGT